MAVSLADLRSYGPCRYGRPARTGRATLVSPQLSSPDQREFHNATSTATKPPPKTPLRRNPAPEISDTPPPRSSPHCRSTFASTENIPALLPCPPALRTLL